MPKGFVKRNGAWVELKKLYVKKNGAWTNLATGYLKKNGTWVKIFSASGPSLNTSPTITGAGGGKLFSVYTATNGSWDGNGLTLTYTRQWGRADSSAGPFTNISGATGLTYTTTADDDGKYITVTVRATDTNSAFAEAAATPAKIVKYIPVNLTKSLSGTASEGSELTVASTWKITTDNTNDTKPDSYTYKWESRTTGNVLSELQNTTSNKYTLTSTEVGKYVRVTITATNSGGDTVLYVGETASTVTAGLGAFTISDVTSSNGVAKTMSSLDDLTVVTATKKVTASWAGGTGAELYKFIAYGTAFNPDSTAGSPSQTVWFTGTSNVFYYDDTAGEVSAHVQAASKPTVTVSWGASTGANAYTVTYLRGTVSITSSLITSGTSLVIDAFGTGSTDSGLKTIKLTEVKAYENADGTGATKIGTLPTTVEKSPTIAWGTGLAKSYTLFVAPTFGGSNPSWTGASNFQRTSQTTQITGRRLTSNQAYIYYSGYNNLAVGASVTIAGVSTTFNGTYTIGAVGSDTNGYYIRYAKTATNVAYAAVTSTSALITATSGIRWGWTNGTRTWLGSYDTADYGWYWEVATSTTPPYDGDWGGGWKQYTTTDQSTLVNNTAYKYVVFSNAAETGLVYGSTAARYGRVQAFSLGTDGQYYYGTFTSYI